MKQHQSFYIVLCVVLICTVICGCSAAKSVADTTDNKTQESSSGMMLTEDLFAEDYSSSAGFIEIRADVIELYNLSRTAYDQSDKERISTFIIDQDRFDLLYRVICDTMQWNFSTCQRLAALS